MKNLSDFKRRIKVGAKIEAFNHNIGHLGTRSVGHVQTNSFAFNTVNESGENVLSWCDFPKAKNIEFLDENTATIYWGEGERRKKILTYRFVD